MPRKPNKPQDPFWKKAKPNRKPKQKRKKATGSGLKQEKSRQKFKEQQKPQKKQEAIPDPNQPVRLNRYIAQAGVCSRREADQLIAAGEIKVNGAVVVEMGHKVHPRKDKVEYHGKVLKAEKLVYILLNKPKNFITTTSDPEGRPTVLKLVKNATQERIFPVGRLDRNTTGLLLLTNDGDLAKKMTHPSHEVKKLYYVRLDKEVLETDLKRLREGIELEDGLAKADKASYVQNKGANEVGIEIHIGRNRIVRRMFEAMGYEVLGLDRVMLGPLDKKKLPRGKWRNLTSQEVAFLKML